MIGQDLEKEELPPHMTRVSTEEIRRVNFHLVLFCESYYTRVSLSNYLYICVRMYV